MTLMKTLWLCACLVPGVIVAADGDNLLKPTNKVESWRFELHEGGKGKAEAVEDAIVFTVTEVDGTNWHVQAIQTDLDLKEGQRYVLSFEIKAEQPTSLSVTAGIDQEDWHYIGLDEFVFATTEYKTREFTFTATDVAPKKNRIAFVIGESKGKISLRNVVLKAKAQ